MPLDFPNNPTIGQVYGDLGLSWTWDGTKWASVPTNTTGPFLPIAGGAMGGALTLVGNATLALAAVPLQQLNAAVASAPFLPSSGGTVAGSLTVFPPSGGAPLQISVNAGNDALILFNAYPTREWAAGVLADGRFVIADETSVAQRILIDSAGLVTVAGAATIGGHGIAYPGISPTGTFIGFAWQSGKIDVVVDGTFVGYLTPTSSLAADDAALSARVSALTARVAALEAALVRAPEPPATGDV